MYRVINDKYNDSLYAYIFHGTSEALPLIESIRDLRSPVSPSVNHVCGPPRTRSMFGPLIGKGQAK